MKKLFLCFLLACMIGSSSMVVFAAEKKENISNTQTIVSKASLRDVKLLVKDKSEKPVCNLTVEIGEKTVGMTDENGEVLIPKLKVGKHTVVLKNAEVNSSTDKTMQSIDIVVTKGQGVQAVKPITWNLPTPYQTSVASPTGVVLQFSGLLADPMAGVSVEFYKVSDFKSGKISHISTTDLSGYATFTNYIPEEYYVKISKKSDFREKYIYLNLTGAPQKKSERYSVGRPNISPLAKSAELLNKDKQQIWQSTKDNTNQESFQEILNSFVTNEPMPGMYNFAMPPEYQLVFTDYDDYKITCDIYLPQDGKGYGMYYNYSTGRYYLLSEKDIYTMKKLATI